MSNLKFTKIYFLLCFFIVFIIPGLAQEGTPFITHFDLAQLHDKQIFDFEQDLDQVMLMATRKGIYLFDSEERNLIKTSHIPLIMNLDPLSGIIYTGCRDDIGYLKKNPDGQYYYHSLSRTDSISEEFYMIQQNNFYVYFAGENNLFRIRKNNPDDFLHLIPDSLGYFAGMFSFGNKIYVNVINHGIFEVGDSSLIRQDFGDNFRRNEILFSFPFLKGEILAGTDDNRLYRFNGNNFQEFTIQDQQYLDESILADGIEIDTSRMAFSTLLGGCLIVDKANGKTINTFNIRTGLPDDEIYAIGKDRNQGIWLSHTYGLTRIDTRFPVRNYNSYPGIQGTMVNMTVFKNNLYVSTNEGIYHLAEKKGYVAKEVYVKVKQEEKPEIKPTEEISKEETVVPEQLQEKLSKRDIRKLKRQLKKEEKVPESEKGQEQEEKRDLLTIIKDSFKKLPGGPETTEEKQQSIYRKQKIYALQTISHEYVKIPGLDRKSDLLVNFGDRILAGGPAGLYEIINEKAQPVFPNWNVEFIKVSIVPGRVFVGTDKTTYLLSLSRNKWQILHEFSELPGQVFSVCEENEETLWFGSDNLAYKVHFTDNSIKELKPYFFYGEVYDPVYTKEINDSIYFFLASGIYTLKNDTITSKESGKYAFELLPQYYLSEEGIAWLYVSGNWFSFYDSAKYEAALNAYLNLFEKIQQIFIDDAGNLWIIHGNGLLYKLVSAEVANYEYQYSLFLSDVSDRNNNLYNFWDLSLDYHNRSVSFNFTAPFYLTSQPSQYQYYIEGLHDQWSEWSPVSKLSFPLIPPGKHYLHIRARNILGKFSNEFIFSFVIHPPFWLTWWFISLCVLLLAGLVLVIIRLRVRKLERDKRILEQKVRERTAEVVRQKNEIEMQKQEIMDSIRYAQRIQKAVLPSSVRISKILPENFILFLPRDIVSGDFYWMTQKEKYSVFAAADCTGHGVPGAFMSMLGVSFLNEIVNQSTELKANIVLEQLRELVKSTLSQSDESESKDGMDIALCILHHKTHNLQYAGAFNPLYLIRNNELIEVKADRMPIGIYHGKESGFTNNELNLKKGDCLYVFSDGYMDQIGGEKGKKLLSKTLKDILLKIHKETMVRQKDILYESLTRWMGNYQQVDDILIIGIRI